MKTSLSRSIVKFFHNIVFSKKALVSFALITLFASNLSLLCMESDAKALLIEAERLANSLGPVGTTVAKGVAIATAVAVIATNVDLDATQRAISTALTPSVVNNPNPNITSNDGSHSVTTTLVNPISSSDLNLVQDRVTSTITPATTTPAVVTPAVVTPVVVTPAVVTPAVVTPAVVTPAVVTPAVVTPAVVTPAVVTPAVNDSAVTFLNQQEETAKAEKLAGNQASRDFLDTGTTDMLNQHPKIMSAAEQIQENPTNARFFDHEKEYKAEYSKLSAADFKQLISMQWQRWGYKEFKDDVELAFNYWSYYQYPGFRELIRSQGTRYEDFIIHMKNEFWAKELQKKNKGLIRSLDVFDKIDGVKSDWIFRPTFNGKNAIKKWLEREEGEVKAQKALRASTAASSSTNSTTPTTPAPAATPATTPGAAATGAPAPDPKDKDDDKTKDKPADEPKVRMPKDYKYLEKEIKHIFQPDHVTKGIDLIRKTRLETLEMIRRVVEEVSSEGLLKEKDNDILFQIKNIKGEIVDFTIRAFGQNGKIINIDAFVGRSARAISNPIFRPPLLAVAVLPTIPAISVNAQEIQGVTAPAQAKISAPAIQIDDKTQVKKAQIFSLKNKRAGVYEKFGPTDKKPRTQEARAAAEAVISETFKKIVQETIDKGELKPGLNRIQTTINGFDAEIRTQVGEDGKVISIDCLPYHYKLTTNPGELPIIKVSPVVTRGLSAATALSQNVDPNATTSASAPQAASTSTAAVQVDDSKKEVVETSSTKKQAAATYATNKEETAKRTQNEQAAQEKKPAEDAKGKTTAIQKTTAPKVVSKNRKIKKQPKPKKSKQRKNGNGIDPKKKDAKSLGEPPKKRLKKKVLFSKIPVINGSRYYSVAKGNAKIVIQNKQKVTSTKSPGTPAAKKQKLTPVIKTPEVKKPVETAKLVEKPVETVKLVEKPAETVTLVEKPVETTPLVEKPVKTAPVTVESNQVSAAPVITEQTAIVKPQNKPLETLTPEGQAAAKPENTVEKQAAEQQTSSGEKHGLDTTEVGGDVAPAPAAKILCLDTSQSSSSFDARKELAQQMAAAYKSNPAEFPHLLKEFKKQAAPAMQRYEEQLCSQTAKAKTDSSYDYSDTTRTSNPFENSFDTPFDSHCDPRTVAAEGALVFILLNPEGAKQAVIYTAKGVFYLCKLSYTSNRDLLMGRTFSYLFCGPVESDIKASNLEYLSFENACINSVDPNEMSEYERITSWKMLKHIKATFECNIKELNEQKQKFEKAVNDTLALLQLPPKNLEEIQKNAAEKQPDLTGSEDPDDARVIKKAVITGAHEVCIRYPRRIALAQAAKKEFDVRKFDEAKENLREAIGLYNDEQPHWISWRDNHAILNPEEKIKKEYVSVSEKYQPAIIKAFTGTHTQHIFHGVIVQELNTCHLLVHENRYNVSGNCTIFTLESLINALLDIAEQFNLKNEFYKASYLIKACRELNLLAKELSEINQIKDMGFFKSLSFNFGSLFFLESRFGIRFKNRIVIKGEPWPTTPPHLDQIAENLSLALLSSFHNQKDLNERFLPQVIKLLKDLETKQPDSPENAIAFVANTLFFGDSPVQQIDEPAKKMFKDLRTAIRRECLINLKIEEIRATAPIKTILIKTLHNVISKIQTGQYNQALKEAFHQPEQPAPQTNQQQELQQGVQAAPRTEQQTQQHEQAPAPQVAPQMGQIQGHVTDVELQDTPQDPVTVVNCAGLGQGSASAATSQTVGQVGATDEAMDEIMAALHASMEELPRPSQIYRQHASTIDHHDRAAVRALIIQCDEINKTTGFDTQIPINPSIMQLPGLFQFYEGLELLPEYGSQYGALCGYYAAHFAKIFAANPHATHQELIERLNDRNAFEAQTLIPGKQVILTQRVETQQAPAQSGQAQSSAACSSTTQQVSDQQVSSEIDVADLQGNEIEQLLSPDERSGIIIIGSMSEEDAIHDEDSFAHATLLTQRFKAGQIDHLIYILPTDGHNHWITVIARREGNQHVHLIVADSIGMDRRSMEEITNVYQDLVSPEQQAAEQLAAGLQAPQQTPQQEQHPGVQVNQ